MNLVSFGYKYGLPADADLVFDVRFLPNPFYVDELRDLTGADPAVASYLDGLPETRTFLRHAETMLDFLMPKFVQEGKAQLTIAIGCTGGRHRSVYISRKLERHLQAANADTALLDRDIHRPQPTPEPR